ncbi:MAG: PAS domain S-box protein [Deltaproteobacteria bacterium]|nr:PAS domain S-box protein [Deltaproteobacteria bacterium]
MAVKSKKDRIGKMIETLRKSAEGDFFEKLDVSAKNDEIDLLADAVNKAVEKACRLTAAENHADIHERTGERRYKDILDTIEESYFEVDLKGNLIFFNDTVSRDLGYTADELAGMHFRQLTDRKNGDMVYEVFHCVFLTGKPIKGFDWEILKKDGTRLAVESSVALKRNDHDKPIGFRGIVRDAAQRKQAEKELRQSEERYRTILEIMGEGYAEEDLKGTLTYVNDVACKLMGYRREELIGMNYRQYTTPETARDMYEVYRRIYETGRPVSMLDYDVICKDGAVRKLQQNAALLTDESGQPKGFRVLVWDVTEKIKAQQAVKESEKLYRMIVENMHEIIWTMDLDLHFKYTSPSNAQITGFTTEEVKKTPLRELLTPASYGLVEKVFLEEMALELSGEPFDPKRSRIMELESRHKNGGTVWVEVTASFSRDENGKPVEIIINGRDITERKTAEKALESSDKRYRMIVENMHDTITIVDLNMNYLYQSPSEIRVTGFTPEEVMKIPISKQVTPASLNLMAGILAEELELEYSGRPFDPNRFRTFEVESYRKNGDIIWLEFTATFNRDEQGKPVTILLVGRDITQRKKAEEEKEKLEKQLIQARKMETVGRLAGGVAHDFNNMLNVIMGYAELTKMSLSEDSEIMQNILEIEKAAFRSRDLTAQLLAFSRKQIIAPKMINLNSLISDTQNSIARLIGEDIDFNFVPGDDLNMVKIDPSQFEQILMNLAVNARDALPDGGKLTIETANLRIDPTYCQDHLDFIPGDYVLLAVSDNGTGIDKNDLQYIFEPFFTTKAVGKGTGLGLATVYGIVKQHNGFINVYSEPDRGTTFKIYLPASTDAEKEPEDISRQPLIVGAGNILLVEDDDMLRGMITEMLEIMGYGVTAVGNPKEALPLFEDGETSIDLVITDVVMPGMNGRELRDRLNNIRPGVKVLFMSGYTSNVIVHHGVLEDGVHFIQKPFNMNVLARKIAEIIAVF